MLSKKKIRYLLRFLPMSGCFATGLTYAAIGTIALLSYLQIVDGGADETSLVDNLLHYKVGKVVVFIILGGSVNYMIWRIYESLYDPYGYGKGIKGILLRLGIGLSTVADGLIVYSVLHILYGTKAKQIGPLAEERQLMEHVLNQSWGSACLIGIGGTILITAVVLMYYGCARGYKERLEIDYFHSSLIQVVHGLALIGFVARSTILGIIGFFYLKAGILSKAQYVKNTDKAFDFIGDHVGHMWFIVIAIGTICYGIFTFTLGFAYDVDKD